MNKQYRIRQEDTNLISDIIFMERQLDVISGYFMDISNDVIKVKNEEAMIRGLSNKICKALKGRE